MNFRSNDFFVEFPIIQMSDVIYPKFQTSYFEFSKSFDREINQILARHFTRAINISGAETMMPFPKPFKPPCGTFT